MKPMKALAITMVKSQIMDFFISFALLGLLQNNFDVNYQIAIKHLLYYLVVDNFLSLEAALSKSIPVHISTFSFNTLNAR